MIAVADAARRWLDSLPGWAQLTAGAIVAVFVASWVFTIGLFVKVERERPSVPGVLPSNVVVFPARPRPYDQDAEAAR